MKRVLTLIMMSILAVFLFAQEAITIGTGNLESIAPVITQFNYSVSQMIYTSAELQEAGLTSGLITNLRFQAGSAVVNLTNTRFWNIRMMETTETNVDDWLDPANSIEVYNEDHGVDMLPAGEWLNLTLSTPFVYSGVQNLLVQVMDMTPNFASANRFRGHTTTNNLTRYAFRDSEPFTPADHTTFIGEYAIGGTATSSTRRPNMQITYTTPTQGLDLAVDAFTGPSQIPGTTPMSITIINAGTVVATGYSVAIFEVGGTDTALHTIPTESIIELPNTYNSTIYTVDSTIYNQWSFTGVGNIVLQAQVAITDDLNNINDTKTISTYILPNYDIQVTGFTGPGMLPTVHPFYVTLHNNGLQAISATDYTVTLYEAGSPDVEITSLASVALPVGATDILTITPDIIGAHEYVNISAGATTFKVVVTLTAGDQLPGDNVETYYIRWFAGDANAIVEVGFGETNTSNELPFRLTYDDSYAQSIYRPADFAGIDAGMITHIMYFFNRTTGNPPDPYPVNIYLANFNGRPNGFTSDTDWVPHSQFTLVVEDFNLALATMSTGTHEIWIPLTTPFLYTGGDLVVMTYKDHEEILQTLSNGFYRTNNIAGSNITLAKGRMDVQGGEEFDPSDVEIGVGNMIETSLFGFKPQMRFAFITAGTTDAGDLAITRFTIPTLIPPNTNENIVINITNFSTTVDVVASDYTIEIAEMLTETPPTWFTLATLSSTSTPPTVAITAGHSATASLVIPSSLYNLWAFQGGEGLATLRAKIIYTADTNPDNNETSLTTALRPPFQVLLTAFTAPMLLPEADPILVTVANNGRSVVEEESYAIEIFQVYTSVEGTVVEHSLYKIGDEAIGAQETAEGIALGEAFTYTIPLEVYNAWNYDLTAPETFTLKAVLTYSHAGQDVTNDISLEERQLRPQNDLEVVQLTGPAIVPSFTPITIQVRNSGRNTTIASDYSLRLYVQGDTAPTLLYTFGIAGEGQTEDIDITETKTLIVPFADIRTALVALPVGQFTFMAEVEQVGDGDATNNIQTLASIKSSIITDGIAEVGISDTNLTLFDSNGFLPFAGSFYDSISQSIYTNADLAGLASGLITHINYRYFRGTHNFRPGPVNLYMANANKPDGFISDTDWLPYTNFTLVKSNFDVDDTELANGLNELWVELDSAFIYNGEELIIMTHKENQNPFYNLGDGFYQTDTVLGSNASLYRASNSGNYNVQDPAVSANGDPTRLHYKPQMRFAVIIPSVGADLGITSFTGTDIIPGTQPLLVTVQNMGVPPISAGTYSIEFYEGEVLSPLYTLVGTAELPELGSTHEYSIPAEIYNTWAYVGAEGAVTLKAVIDYAIDSNPANNTATFATNLRPFADIEMLSVTGPALFPAVRPLIITLQNNGREVIPAQSYSLLVSVGASIIHTIPISATEEIGLAEQKIYSIPAATINPLLANVPVHFTFTAVVDVIETEPYDINNTATLAASIFNEFETDAIAEAGIDDFETSLWLPLNLQYEDNISQSIYHSSYFGDVGAGLITHINYQATVGWEISNYPVSIYMANLNKESFSHDYDWVPGSQFTCVANLINLPIQSEGYTSFWLQLDTPFFYTGDDVIVMMHSDQMEVYFLSYFLRSANGNLPISLFQRYDNYTFDPYNLSGVEGDRVNHIPQTRFAFTLGEYGVLSGNAVFAGVTVAQGERAVTSAANGEYTIYVDTQDPTPITFLKEGYDLVTLNINDIQWEQHPQGLPTATYYPTMIAIGVALVSGVVTLADTGLPIQNSVTVHIGSFSGDTANGAYSIGPLYPYITYPVSITLSDNTFYCNFTSELRFTPADVVGIEYTYNITIAESIKAPPYAYANFTSTGGREVSWFNPIAEEETYGLYVPTGGNFSYSEMTDAIFAHKYSAQRLGSMELVDSYLTAVSFLPRRSDQNASIVIWVGNDLSDADVDNPTLEQPITSTIYHSQWNTIALNRPILVPANSELLVGIKSVQTVLWVFDGGNDSFVGAGNIIYIDGFWTDLINLTEGADDGPYYDDWAIRCSFIKPFPQVTEVWLAKPQQIPFPSRERGHFQSMPSERAWVGSIAFYHRSPSTDPLPDPPTSPRHRSRDTRYFNSKYNIYRLPEDATFNPSDAPLNTVQTGGLMPTFIDDSELTGRYRYVVTAVHEGDGYPQGEMQSAPAYSNYLNISPWFTVNGSITRTNGTLAGFEVTLRNQAHGEYSPAVLTTGEDGLFMFITPAGSYLLTVHLEGVNADGEPYGTYSSVVNVAGPTSIPPIDMTAHSDADEVIMPMVTALQGNYPNPFNPTTTIAFDLASEGLVTIEVFNIKGQRVNTVANEVYKAGRHSVVWNGDDAFGRSVGSGVYFYRMQTTDYTQVKKALLLK